MVEFGGIEPNFVGLSSVELVLVLVLMLVVVFVCVFVSVFVFVALS